MFQVPWGYSQAPRWCFWMASQLQSLWKSQVATKWSPWFEQSHHSSHSLWRQFWHMKKRLIQHWSIGRRCYGIIVAYRSIEELYKMQSCRESVRLELLCLQMNALQSWLVRPQSKPRFRTGLAPLSSMCRQVWNWRVYCKDTDHQITWHV